MGRRKIEIAAIADQNKRNVTFSKRRKGLMSKATQMCLLDETVKMGLVVFSPAGNPFSFANVPSVDALLHCFVHDDGTRNPPPFSAAADSNHPSRTRVLTEEEEEEEDREEFWWEKVNVEEIQSVEELRDFQTKLERLKETAVDRLQSIRSRNKTSCSSSSSIAPLNPIDTPLGRLSFDAPPPLIQISEQHSNTAPLTNDGYATEVPSFFEDGDIDTLLQCVDFDLPPLSEIDSGEDNTINAHHHCPPDVSPTMTSRISDDDEISTLLPDTCDVAVDLNPICSGEGKVSDEYFEIDTPLGRLSFDVPPPLIQISEHHSSTSIVPDLSDGFATEEVSSFFEDGDIDTLLQCIDFDLPPLLSEINSEEENINAAHRHCPPEVPPPLSWISDDDEINALLLDTSDMAVDFDSLF